VSYHYYQSKIIDIIDETTTTKRFYFKFRDEIKFSFKAGQFVMLDMPIHDKHTNRSYSIASAPSDDNILELIIVRKEQGAGTTYLFDEAKIGSEIKVSQPLGKLLLPDPILEDICFVCTGTGIAPFRSQLLDIYHKKIPHKNLYLIFGNRKREDILYRKEFEELEDKLEGFHFIPVLSRETPETWDGRIGYVHQVYQEVFADKHPAFFYICGWQMMLREARQKIEALGYDRKRIRFEAFD
jgi:ferredoxin-NADP reductase